VTASTQRSLCGCCHVEMFFDSATSKDADVQWLSVTLPERRRLDAERPQIHVSLTAMMYFIIDGVLNRRQPRGFPLAERLVHFAEPVRWNLWELLVQLRGLLIPKAEKFAFARP
jgi:hypothetical protein